MDRQKGSKVYKVRSLAIPGIALVPVLLAGACSHGADKSRAIRVPNGEFENGIMDPWAAFQAVQAAVSGDHVHGGKFSLAESVAKGSVYEDVNGFAPGTAYTISAWVSGSPGATAKAQIAIFDGGSNLASFSNTINPTTGWQLLRYEFKLSVAAQGVARIHLFRNDGTGTIFWDDVQIARTE